MGGVRSRGRENGAIGVRETEKERRRWIGIENVNASVRQNEIGNPTGLYLKKRIHGRTSSTDTTRICNNNRAKVKVLRITITMSYITTIMPRRHPRLRV